MFLFLEAAKMVMIAIQFKIETEKCLDFREMIRKVFVHVFFTDGS